LSFYGISEKNDIGLGKTIGHTKMSKPMIAAVIEAFKSYKANQPSEYDVDKYIDKFTDEYMENHINTEEKMKAIFLEYGMKKLIDHMLTVDDEEICDDLVEPMSVNGVWKCWLSQLIMNICYDNENN